MPNNHPERWWTCPRCGLPNISARRICKRCRFFRDAPAFGAAPPAVPFAATEETGVLYITPNHRHVLVLLPAYLEYSGPDRAIRTRWDNILGIQTEGGEQILRLHAPSAIRQTRSQNVATDTRLAQTIPIWRFGYATDPIMQATLGRFAPHLATTGSS